MEEMTVKQGEFPATLDPYVQQGRMFLFNAAQNLIQYGRVLTEAKPLVPRGQFENWVRLNFNMSERSAQGYMQVWKRFGSNAMLQDVQFSNLQKMLALPEGTENQFAEENDLKTMTAREVEKAVRQVRQEEQDKLNLALADAKQEMTQALNRKEGERLKLEARLREAEAKTAEPDRALVAAIAEKDAHIRTLQWQADKANQDRNEANRNLQQARDELRDLEEALKENQQAYNQMQAELLNAQSTIARGDAERVISEQFTIDDFSAAVRGFLGSVAQLPYMGEAFLQMVDQREYRQWDSLLKAVEDWAEKSRKAMNTAMAQEAYIDG